MYRQATMHRQAIEESAHLYEFPYAAFFRDYVQAYLPLRQHVVNYLGTSADHAIYQHPHNLLQFQKLSSETTREIFVLACGRGVLGALAHSPQHQLRLTLQLVCQDWRRIVINTPVLWNDLDLRISSRCSSPGDDLAKVTLADVDSWIHRARSWLHHAGNSLISLHLLVFPCLEAGVFPVVLPRRVISFLSDYRFRTLSVHAPVASFLDFDESLNASLHNVSILSLSAPMSTYPFMRLYWRPPLFPSLKCLSLALSDAFICEDLLLAFPWHQLSQLQLGTIKQLDLTADILCRCKSLVDCTIHIEECDGVSLHLKDIHLPHLQRLSLASSIVGSAIECVLRATIAPKLMTLSVSGLFGACIMTLEAVKFTATRSGFQSSLQKLVLRSFEGVVDLHSVVDFFPSLRFVEVVNTTVDQASLDSLADGSVGACLKEIHLAGYDLMPGTLLDMVVGRQERAKRCGSRIAPLASVSFCFPSTQFQDITAQYCDRVARLQAEHNIDLMLGAFLHIPDYSEIADDETALNSDLIDAPAVRVNTMEVLPCVPV